MARYGRLEMEEASSRERAGRREREDAVIRSRLGEQPAWPDEDFKRSGQMKRVQELEQNERWARQGKLP